MKTMKIHSDYDNLQVDDEICIDENEGSNSPYFDNYYGTFEDEKPEYDYIVKVKRRPLFIEVLHNNNWVTIRNGNWGFTYYTITEILEE